MKFVIDPPKRAANMKRHGFDLAALEDHFDFERFLAVAAAPSETGRERFKFVGRWSDGRTVTAIMSPLGAEAMAVVSLRIASKRERQAYDDQTW